MRGTFRWERDTENYRRYVSETREPSTGKFRVIYFPKSFGGDMPKAIEDLIVSDSDNGLQCCERDNDWDGNCSIHSAPGVLRELRTPAHIRQMELYKYAGEHLHGLAYDLCPRPFSSRNLYSPESIRAMVMQLMTRMNVVEKRQSLLFQFADKVVKILRHWGLNKR